MTESIERRQAFSILIQPAEGVPGEWLAHCLELDVMAQGRSLSEAVESIQEVLELSLSDDREAAQAGLAQRRASAPDEFWTEWFEVLNMGKRVQLKELEQSGGAGIKRIAMVMYMRIIEQQDPAERLIPFGNPSVFSQAERYSAPASPH